MNEDSLLELTAKTDYEILQNHFGDGYFVLVRLKTKIDLTPPQKQELQDLIDERNHFGILFFVTGLRKVS